MKDQIRPSINFEFCFEEKFETVWKSVKNLQTNNRMTNKLFNGTVGQPIFDRGNSSYELDAKFYFSYRDRFIIHMTTIKIEKTDDYACIKWECKLDPSDTLYDMTFQFFSKNDGLACLFELETIYKTERNFSPGEIEQIMKENFSIWSNIERCIKEEKITKIQEEKITISSTSIESICDMLLNLKQFQKNIPMCCDAVEYSGSNLEVGSMIIMEWFEKQKLKVFLRVTAIEKKNDFFSLKYESVGSSLPIPPQIIEWRVEKLPGISYEYLIKFIHFYKHNVHEDALTFIAKNKQDILSILKIKIESAELFGEVLFNNFQT